MERYDGHWRRHRGMYTPVGGFGAHGGGVPENRSSRVRRGLEGVTVVLVTAVVISIFVITELWRAGRRKRFISKLRQAWDHQKEEETKFDRWD